MTAVQAGDLDRLLTMVHNSGDRFVRVGTDALPMGGVGYDAQGNIRQDWSANWEGFLDKAESYGIYVLPFFTGWANWNDRWDDSPFNSANGGPADDPSESTARTPRPRRSTSTGSSE